MSSSIDPNTLTKVHFKMERLKDTLTSILPDESLVEYMLEVADASETIDEFQEVAVPILLEAGDVASSEEDAIDLCRALFNLLTPPTPPETTRKQPIIMAQLLSEPVADPFANERLALARLQIQEVGKVVPLSEQIDSRSYQKSLKKEEALIETVRKTRLQANEKEAAQFRRGMGFRRPAVRAPRHLSLQDITVTIGPHTLIENSSLTVSPGNRYGLVGRNGLGKTTLMKFINSSLLRGVPGDMLIIHVEQEAPMSDRTVLQAVLDVDIERTELLEEILTCEDPARITEISDRLEQIGANGAEARAAMILNALGFSNEMLSRPLSACSGGFRMRVSLAQALYIQPDVLLLDEPTGHLDAPSVCWLEEFLASQCKDQILIVISHDRVFLDAVTTHIVHLKDKSLNVYKGNFSSFLSQFETKVSLIEDKAEAQKRDIDHKMDFVRRLGVKAASASLAQSRLKAIEKIQVVKTIKKDPPVRFDFSISSLAAQENLITMEDISFTYPNGPEIFKHLSFTVKRNTRAVIIGANGTGKSTLINLLMGKLKPQTGFYQMVSNLKVEHFSQHHVDQLDYKVTPLQFMLNRYKADHSLPEIRQHLGKFGVSGEMSLQPIQSLSGGQKTRVVLASCAMNQPHLLLLDEVTNNLDMDSIEALGEALNRYQGAIVAVTHDQHFAMKIANEIYVCSETGIDRFDGTFDMYRNQIKEKIREKFFRSTVNKGIL